MQINVIRYNPRLLRNIVALLLLFLFAACDWPQELDGNQQAVAPTSVPTIAVNIPTAQPSSSLVVPASTVRAIVVDTIDGDTIDVDIEGNTERVRMIGVDTPETRHPTKGVECYGTQAAARTAELLAGKTVYLEDDQSQDSRDRYGRILRYVWLEDGINFNMRLITEGYAFEYTYETPYKYQADFKQAQAEAQQQGRGLWAASACNGEQKPANNNAASPSSPTAPNGSTTSLGSCESDPGSATNTPVKITGIDKQAETVSLQNMGSEPIDLAGWTMCSIRGGQRHPLDGQIAPGETRIFPNTGAQIWSNSQPDPGALYDPEGRLVSYWGNSS